MAAIVNSHHFDVNHPPALLAGKKKTVTPTESGMTAGLLEVITW
jgi:hypothetical protein